jgi:phenylpropionate dioxygenase-like ring-hydroxylating dioxygenase large terminal subunit
MDPDMRPGIPNGWYAVAWSKDVAVGEVKRVRCFEEELVLFRTRSGKARVLSAYCSHIGAHLAEGGRVVGESVRCPFHAWEYDGETGECVKIPYCARVPQKARQRVWEVDEVNHMIMVWHHAEQKPPSWSIQPCPHFENTEWSAVRTFEMEVPVHVQDMAENNMDPVHFRYVHDMLEVPDQEISLEEDGRLLKAVSYSQQETPMGTFDMSLLRESECIGHATVESRGIPTVGLFMFTSTSPIDRHTSYSRWALIATNNAIDIAGEEWMTKITEGVEADFRIWKNKIHRSEPLFCEADTYLVEFRKWVKQFYSPSQKPEALASVASQEV